MGKWLATDLRNVILGSDIETEFISMVYIFFCLTQKIENKRLNCCCT